MPELPPNANTPKAMVTQDIQRAMDRLSLLLEHYFTERENYHRLQGWSNWPKEERTQALNAMNFVCFEASEDLHLAYSQAYPEDAAPWLEEELSKRRKWNNHPDFSSELSCAIEGLELANSALSYNSFAQAETGAVMGLGATLEDVHKKLSTAINIIHAAA